MANVQLRTESIKRSKGKSLEGSSNGVSRRKRLWTTVEDLILVDYVKRYGERNWANVQRVTGLARNGKSCRLRWTDQLHPGLNKEPFTFEEEMLIADLQSQVGNKWSIIAEFLPGRTDNAIKNYWYNRRKRSKMAGLDPDQVTESSNTFYNGFQLNQQNLSPVNYNLKPEPIEFSSIQHDDALYYSASSSAQNVLSMIKSEGWFMEYPPPQFNTFSTASSCFTEDAHPINALTNECKGGLVDPMQTEGDLVDLWLQSSSPDDEAIGNTAAANCELVADNNAEFPSWLNSPSLDEFLDQQPICRNNLCTDDEAINNVAVTEESTNCVNSAVMNDLQEQESISQAVGCENGGAMINIEELLYEFKSPRRDGFLDQEKFGQDLVYYEDYGAIGDFAATYESSVQCYEWDETSDFWSTPFKTGRWISDQLHNPSFLACLF